MTNKIIRIDFETRSSVPLGGKLSVGLHNYAIHPDTQVLMMAYKYSSDVDVEIWEPHQGPLPLGLHEDLLDPSFMISAFNSAFERYILQYQLGITIPANRFLDPQVGARYLSLPASLEEVGEILDLPMELRKDKRGETLIDLFSQPHKAKKKKGEPDVWYFNDWNTHPKEWREFLEYNKQDVRTEEEIARRMGLLQVLPLPEIEQKIWILDQKINDRGIPCDIALIKAAYKLAERSKQEAIDAQNKLTGLDNANSTKQLLPWAQERGYPVSTLRKDAITSALKDPDVKLTDECRQALLARKEASSTTYKKLVKILQQVSPDGRLRHQFIFMGSSRCGRWSSGGGAQLHNMARPDKVFEELDNLVLARELIRAEKYDEIKQRFGSVLLTVKNCIRTMFSCETE